jgi:predicted CoA-binding protein
VPPDRARVAAILRSARRIAVVGLSPRPERPSHGVASYLQRAGYTIIPVRPTARSILGEPVQPDLKTAAAAAGPIDIVDIFRRSEFVPALLDDLLEVRPRLVWMQVGIRDDETAARLEAAGIPVVMDRCLAVDHHSLGG